MGALCTLTVDGQVMLIRDYIRGCKGGNGASGWLSDCTRETVNDDPPYRRHTVRPRLFQARQDLICKRFPYNIVTNNHEEQKEEHQRAVILGGAKGFLGGLGVALPASYILYRRWPYYRNLQPSLKAFGVILVAVPSFVISAERAGLRYERQRWDDLGTQELQSVHERERAKWERMNVKEKFADFARRHPFSLITGSWATSMIGIYTWVSRDPLATPLQKITQTRVWAQGITLGIIITAAILTHRQSEDKYVDHSWRDILEREAAEERAIKARAQAKAEDDQEKN
ncbi:RCF2_2 [Sanghuangporus weigelae]